MTVPGPPPCTWGQLLGVGIFLSSPEEERKIRRGVWVRVIRRREHFFALCNPCTQEQSFTNSLFDMVITLKMPFYITGLPSLWGFIPVSGKLTMPTSTAKLQRPRTPASLLTPAAGWFGGATFYSFGKSWEESQK